MTPIIQDNLPNLKIPNPSCKVSFAMQGSIVTDLGG